MVIHVNPSKITTPLVKFTVSFAQLPLEGLIVLQNYGGEIWFRNILVWKSDAP
jgi:hypothetical protein